MLPGEVLDLLAGRPGTDRWEPVFPLLTADADGTPRVCLLSRAEVEAEPETLRVVLRSRRTSANLRRTGIAVLQAVGADTSYTIRAELRRTITDDNALAAALTIIDVEHDSLGIPLSPMTYQADPTLAETESWAGNATLLTRLRHPDA